MLRPLKLFLLPSGLSALAALIVLTALAPPGASTALAAPPQLLSAMPDHADSGVDPALTELVFEFDQDMDGSRFSICGGGPTFPETTGQAHWRDARTLVLPVRLKPNTAYRISINCASARNTRSATGEPAASTPIWFETGAPGSAPHRLEADSNRKAVARLRTAVDQRYSHRDRLGLDWPARFEKYGPRMIAKVTPGAFAREAAELLSAAQDIHVTLMIGDVRIPTYVRHTELNFDLARVRAQVRDWREENPTVATAWAPGPDGQELGYLLIRGWDRSRADDLAVLYEILARWADRPGLIVDVRPNGGGDELLAREFAGCFLDKPAVYSRHVTRDPQAPGGFTHPQERVVHPNPDRPRFRGRVAVLIGPACMSSNESFIQMMKQVPGCRSVGAPTFGSSGNPKPHDLGNGVTVLLPSWKDLQSDGQELEGRGVQPDVTVPWDPQGQGDSVLAAAIRVLTS